MSATIDKTLKLLTGAESILSKRNGIVGLDGFVDQILRAVDKRQKDGTPTYIPDIPTFSSRSLAAAGRSTKFDLSVQQVKLGGNGPIMAQALARMGLSLTCIGNMGFPELHPIFEPMKKLCKVITVADASYTDALEFNDGKIMLSRQESAREVTWEALERVIGADKLFKLFDESDFVALDNWSALPAMSDIWEKLQEKVCSRFSAKPDGSRRKIFFDLADPEFRLPEDIRQAMTLIAGFQKTMDATLGLNQKEAAEICEILDLHPGGKDREFVSQSAKMIRSKLEIIGVVVHATAFAAAASKDGFALVEGPFVEKPLISTGAGDHFNAGYSLGNILGGDLEQCLQLGVATSGFYVRTAISPTLADLKKFLEEIK